MKLTIVEIALWLALVVVLLALLSVSPATFAQSPEPTVGPQIPPGGVELIGERTLDSSTFILPDGQRQTIFQRGMNTRFVGSTATDGDVIIAHSADKLIMTGVRGGQITWDLPTASVVRGEKALAYVHDGLGWEYRLVPGGMKLTARVDAHRGLHAYTFPFITTSRLTSQLDGSILGEGFRIAPPRIVDINGQEVKADWVLAPGLLTLTFDDSGLALPYLIDPTTTFEPDASADDGTLAGIAAYPPACSSVDTSTATMNTRKGTAGANKAVVVTVIKWDTSSIPDSATVTDADFRGFVTAITDDDARNWEGDWHTVGTIDCGDYSVNVGSSAFSADITGLSTSAYNTLDLTSPTNVVKTGDTGLRLGIDGGSPPGENIVTINSFDNGSNEPQLVVTYTEMTVTAITPDEEAANGTKSFNVTGTSLTGVTAVRLEKSGQPNINCTSVVVNDSTSVDMDCNLSGADDGLWDVVVVDTSTETATGSGLLDIHALAITASDPSSALNTSSESFTVDGDGFDTGVQLHLEQSGQPDINCTSETITVTFIELTADCDLTGVATGFWDVVVTNTDADTATLTNGLLVTTTITLQATGVASGEHTVRVLSDGVTVSLIIDGTTEVTGAAVAIDDTANPWQLFTNNAVPAMEQFTVSLTGSQVLNYQIRDIPDHQLTDQSGEGHHTTAFYPTTTDTTSFSLSSAIAEVEEFDEGASPEVLGSSPAITNFSGADTSSDGGFFIFDVMSDTAVASGFPYQAMTGMFALAVVIVIMVIFVLLFKAALMGAIGAILAMVVLWSMGAIPFWMAGLFSVGPAIFFLVWRKVTA